MNEKGDLITGGGVRGTEKGDPLFFPTGDREICEIKQMKRTAFEAALKDIAETTSPAAFKTC